jgi:hypothetical protein
LLYQVRGGSAPEEKAKEEKKGGGLF